MTLEDGKVLVLNKCYPSGMEINDVQLSDDNDIIETLDFGVIEWKRVQTLN